MTKLKSNREGNGVGLAMSAGVMTDAGQSKS